MNRCEHGYNCANADCHVMFQNMALSRGAAPNLQPARQDGRPPVYAQEQGPASGPPQQQGPPSGYPQQFGPSQPIPIPPRPAPPSYPANTYYPPNSYIHYAQPFAGMPRPHPEMNLPPWTGNGPYSLPPGFSAPRPVEGPPAQMPSGGYIAGTQLPGPAWYIPYNGPYRPRGGGNDYVPQEEVVDDEDFEYDTEDDGDGSNNAFRCLHCRQHCPTSRNKWSIDEDEWAERQGQAGSEEDPREAGPVLGSTDHVMFIEEPGSTDERRSHRLEGTGVQSSAGHLLVKPEKKQQTLHRYFTRQKSRSQIPASKATNAGKKRAFTEDCETASEPANATTLPHDHNSSKTDQTPIGQLRGGRFHDQQPPNHEFPKAKDVKSDSIPPIPSTQPQTSTRLLWLNGRGHLFHTIRHHLGDSWQRSFEPSTPTDKRFVNYVYAHEEQISRAVLEELGIPFYFSEKSHHVVVKADCNDKLLLELLERTRIKRNYAGQCTHGPVPLTGQSGRGDFVPTRPGSERARETELETGLADTSRLRGGSGGTPEREEPTGPSSRPAPPCPCEQHDRTSFSQPTSPPGTNLVQVYPVRRIPFEHYEQQQTTQDGLQGFRRLLRESRARHAEGLYEDRPISGHHRSNWRQPQPDPVSQEGQINLGGAPNSSARQARRLTLTRNFSLQDEDGHFIGLDSLDRPSYPYYIHAHERFIDLEFIRELEVPHRWEPSDHWYVDILESPTRNLIDALIRHTRVERVPLEAAQRRDAENLRRSNVENQRRARFRREDATEGPEQPPTNAGHLRGGARSTSDNESLSPLSPRQEPCETPYGYDRRQTQAIAEQRHHAHISVDDDEDDTRLPSSPTTGGPAEPAYERNRRRLQRSMETRSGRRAEAERERRQILDPELDRAWQRFLYPELEPSRDSLRDIRQQRRNAVDFGTPEPSLPDEEASWVLEQEAAQDRRSRDVSRGRTRRRGSNHDFMDRLTNGNGGSPRRDSRDHGPTNGDAGRPRGGNGGSSSHGHSVTYNGEDEIAPFAMQPGGQEVNLQDVAELLVLLAPRGARLHFRREGVDFVLTRFPVDGRGEGRR